MIGDIGYNLTSAVFPEREAALAGVCECVLSQITRPYPCAAHQTISSPEELELPRDRFPVFYGSYDWHSCVHSHWTLVRMLRWDCLPEELASRAAAQLEESFAPEAIGAEAKSWCEHVPAFVEKPYGWTWFLELDAELGRLAATGEHALAARAEAWRAAAAELTAEMLRRSKGWAEGISMPCRTGTHSDTAWSLAMLWDWALFCNNSEVLELVKKTALRLFGSDKNAPCAYEPNGDTFTSAILNEAALMARVLEGAEYATWLEGYFPQVFNGFESPLLPNMPGKWNGEGFLEVHQVALPTSRALAVRDAAAPLASGVTASAGTTASAIAASSALTAEASRWLVEGVEDVQLSGFLADHWVGSFVCAALLGA